MSKSHFLRFLSCNAPSFHHSHLGARMPPLLDTCFAWRNQQCENKALVRLRAFPDDPVEQISAARRTPGVGVQHVRMCMTREAGQSHDPSMPIQTCAKCSRGCPGPSTLSAAHPLSCGRLGRRRRSRSVPTHQSSLSQDRLSHHPSVYACMHAFLLIHQMQRRSL